MSIDRLVDGLRRPAAYPEGDFRAGGAAPGRRVEMLETHISWVLLTDLHAYKIKKPVDLGFLDFTTLEARRFYCAEELRLNRRIAPSLYLDVVPVTLGAAGPLMGGDGEPVEYALRMRRFPQQALLDRAARDGRLGGKCIDDLAARVAQSHLGLEPAGPARSHASAERILADATQNFDQLRSLAGAEEGALAYLRAWTAEAHAGLADAFAARKRDGYVRECHGDLHLGNIVMLEDGPVPFDCIEFNESFRWIDVMNEVAFLVMDLREHGLPQLAARFLSRYLEATGDYAGLDVLRFYTVYRAMVRAKVACIRAAQQAAGRASGPGNDPEYLKYLAFAQQAAAASRGALVVMHGVSGSGKSFVASQLADLLGALHVRSDVERKRLHGLAPQARSASGLGTGIYAPADTERTYERLADAAGHAVRAGYPVVVDATFLAARQRDRFRKLAAEAGVGFAIVPCAAPDDVLRARIERREALRKDPSEAGLDVLRRQLAELVPFDASEAGDLSPVEAGQDEAAVRRLACRLGERLGIGRQ